MNEFEKLQKALAPFASLIMKKKQPMGQIRYYWAADFKEALWVPSSIVYSKSFDTKEEVEQDAVKFFKTIANCMEFIAV